MPPFGPLLKNDGPACRVCGCTENNACMIFVPLTAKQKRDRYAPNVTGCSWVKVEGATPPLCSVCAGTEADMAEAITRGCRMLQLHSTAGIGMAVKIGRAALSRRKLRRAQNWTAMATLQEVNPYSRSNKMPFWEDFIDPDVLKAIKTPTPEPKKKPDAQVRKNLRKLSRGQ